MPNRWPGRAGIGVLAVLLLGTASQPSAASGHHGLREFGDIGEFALPAAAAAGSLIVGDYRGTTQFLVSGATTFAVTQGLKATVHEERPNGTSDHAFPSGHAASAFAGASFIHYRYGWEWGLPAELAAAVVGYSRVEARTHHWHDVVAGALIAHASSFAFVDPLDERVSLLPFVELTKPSFGLVARVHF